MERWAWESEDMSTMVIAWFESVPMARSAAHALVADGFSEDLVSVFYGRRLNRGGGLWARLVDLVRRRRRSSGEILLVVQLHAAHVQAAISLLRDAGSVFVEQSQNDWQTGPWERATVQRAAPRAALRKPAVSSHGAAPHHRTQLQP